MAPKIGINVDAVAVLEVNSVRIIMLAMLIKTIKIIEIPDKLLLSDPIHAAKPDEFMTVARDNPPPININAPQGILWATSQLINLSLLGLLEGMINKIIAADIAIVESFNAPEGIIFSNALEIHFLDIHKEAVIINTTPTIISS